MIARMPTREHRLQSDRRSDHRAPSSAGNAGCDHQSRTSRQWLRTQAPCWTMCHGQPATVVERQGRRTPGTTLIGIDASGFSINYAKTALRSAGVSASLIAANASSIPVLDNTIALASACFVAHHLKEKEQDTMFSEVHRILKHGGHFLWVDFCEQTGLSRFAHAILSPRGYFDRLYSGKLNVAVECSGFRPVKELRRRYAYGFCRILLFRKQ